MATLLEQVQEAERRGLPITPRHQQLLEEGRRRGLIQTPATEAPVPETAPETGPSTGERALQLANRFAQGGLEGTANLVDLPMHAVNTAANVVASPFTGGERFNLPGTGGARELLSQYQQATGSQPAQPQGFAETLMKALGEQLTGAALTYGAGGLMPAGSMAQQALSSGRLGADATLATGAGLGQGVAETLAPNNPLASMGAQIAGGMAVPAIRGVERAGLSALGIKSAGIGEATGLNPAQLARQRMFAEQGITPAASDVTGNKGVAAMELFPSRFPIGGKRTQDFADQQMREAAQATGEAFSPLGRSAEPLEAGKAAQRDVRPKFAQQSEEAGASIERLIPTIGPRMDRLQSISALKRDVAETTQAFRDANRVLYDSVESVTGDTPIVTLRNLHGATESARSEAAQTGFAAPRGSATLDRLGKPAEQGGLAELQAILTPEYLTKLPPAQRAQAEAAMGSMNADQPIPFWLARRVESELGRIAFSKQQPIGTIDQGKAGRLYGALKRDMDESLDAIPEGSEIKTRLAEANQHYKTGKTMLNDTLLSHLSAAGQKSGKAERVLNTVFGSSKDLEPILDLKSSLSDETWQTFVAHGVASGLQRSMSRGPDGAEAFNPAAFVKWADGLKGTGKLDLLLTPTQRGQWDAEVQKLAGLKETRISRVNDLIDVRDPEKIVDRVFNPGTVQRTQQFSEVADPDVFDDTVRAWATQLQRGVKIPKGKTASGERDLVSVTKLANELTPLIESGQIDIMLKRFPGMAQQLKQFVEVSQGLGKRETLAGNPSGTGPALLAAGQIGSLANMGVDTLAAIASLKPSGLTQAVKTGVMAVGVPYGISRMTTSESGRRVLTEGMKDKYSLPVLRLMERILAPNQESIALPPGDIRSVLPEEPGSKTIKPSNVAVGGIRG